MLLDVSTHLALRDRVRLHLVLRQGIVQVHALQTALRHLPIPSRLVVALINFIPLGKPIPSFAPALRAHAGRTRLPPALRGNFADLSPSPHAASRSRRAHNPTSPVDRLLPSVS